MSQDKERGIDELRDLLRALDQCSEAFLMRFTADQLLAIARAWRPCEHDFHPDEWEDRQIREAIGGLVPRWEEGNTESGYRPLYHGPEQLHRGQRVKLTGFGVDMQGDLEEQGYRRRGVVLCSAEDTAGSYLVQWRKGDRTDECMSLVMAPEEIEPVNPWDSKEEDE